MIENKRSCKKIDARVERADDSFSRTKGLMFASAPKCILFKFDSDGIYPIHSFFVFFHFDAVYLDAKMRVTEVFENVAPFTPLVTPKRNAKYLLELPEGLVRKLGVKEGDRIKVE